MTYRMTMARRSASIRRNVIISSNPHSLSGYSGAVRYIVVPEHTFLLYQLPELTGRADEIVCLAQEDPPADGRLPFAGTVVRGDPARAEAYRALEIQPDDRVILCTVTAGMAERMLDALLSVCATVPVVVLGTEVRSGPRRHGHNVSHVAAEGLVGKAIQEEWQHIRIWHR